MSCRKTVLILIALSIYEQFSRQHRSFEAEVKCAIEKEPNWTIYVMVSLQAVIG